MGEAMRLYHGSKSGIEGPIRPIGSSVNDFGRGFYLGDEPSQPLTLICRGLSGFHTISNDRTVEEMIAIADRRAA